MFQDREWGTEVTEMKKIAVITARSGSKGLKDKNIKLLNGKPLMAYTIEAARRSECFDCVHVSTDSEAYAEIAREYGAEVPFLRDEELASDTSSSWDVMRSVMRRYQQCGRHFDQAMLLQPTSPLRTAEDIQEIFKLMEDKKAKVVVGVCEMDHSPLWSNTLPEDGNMNGFQTQAFLIPRQQLPVYYRINGAAYLIDVDYLMENGQLYGKDSYAYVMPKERSVDIDDQFDFLLVETYMRGIKVNT